MMYDASGVRLHAGRQASVLNMIITELPPDHPVSDTRPLRDTLGHTPLQVGHIITRSDPPQHFYAGDMHAEGAGWCTSAGGCWGYAGHGGWLYCWRHLPVRLRSGGLRCWG